MQSDKPMEEEKKDEVAQDSEDSNMMMSNSK